MSEEHLLSRLLALDERRISKDTKSALTNAARLTTNPTSSSFVLRMRCTPGPELRLGLTDPKGRRGWAIRQSNRLWKTVGSMGRSGWDAIARATSPGRYPAVPGGACWLGEAAGCMDSRKRDL